MSWKAFIYYYYYYYYCHYYYYYYYYCIYYYYYSSLYIYNIIVIMKHTKGQISHVAKPWGGSLLA